MELNLLIKNVYFIASCWFCQQSFIKTCLNKKDQQIQKILSFILSSITIMFCLIMFCNWDISSMYLFLSYKKPLKFWCMLLPLHPTKPKHYCIVWNEPLQALDSMLMHTKLNLSERRHLHTRRKLSETGWQIQLPRKQRLINQKRHRHTTSEGMDSYRWAFDHMEIKPDR